MLMMGVLRVDWEALLDRIFCYCERGLVIVSGGRFVFYSCFFFLNISAGFGWMAEMVGLEVCRSRAGWYCTCRVCSIKQLHTLTEHHSFSIPTHNRRPRFLMFVPSVVPVAKQLYKKADEVELRHPTSSFSRELVPPPRKVSQPQMGVLLPTTFAVVQCCRNPSTPHVVQRDAQSPR